VQTELFVLTDDEVLTNDTTQEHMDRKLLSEAGILTANPSF